MARNRNQRRIDEPILRPTQNLTDNFVPAASPNQINMEGAAAADWTEGFQNLLQAGEKAATVHRKEQDKLLAEAGEAVWTLMEQEGITLDKAVARYTSAGDTPQSLRKKLKGYVTNGQMDKSASPAFRRVVEAGQNQQKATLWSTSQAARMDELVSTAKQNIAGGNTAMMAAIQDSIAQSMTDDMFDGLSTYGAAHLRGLLVTEGNKMAGMALAKAEDELAQETIDAAGSLLVDTTQQMMDTTDATIENMQAAIPGGSVDLNLDAEEYFENDPLNRQFTRYIDSVYDVATKHQQRIGLVNAASAQFEAVANSDMSYDDKVEFVEHILQEAGRARENMGNGPYALPLASDEFKTLIGRKNAILKQLKYDKDEEGGDRTKGYGIGMDMFQGTAAAVKNRSSWDENDSQFIQSTLMDIKKQFGPGAMQGAVNALRDLQGTLGPQNESTRTEAEMAKLLETDRNTAFEQYSDTPINKDPATVSQWLTDNGFNSTESRVAWIGALGKENTLRESKRSTIMGSLLTAVGKVSRDEFTATYGKDDLTDARFAPDATALERELAYDPATEAFVAGELDKYVNGGATLDETTIAIETGLRMRWNELMDTRGSLEDIKRREAKETSDALAAVNAQRMAINDDDEDTPRENWIESGPWTELNTPDHPWKPDRGLLRMTGRHLVGTPIREVANNLFVDMNTLVWEGPGLDTKEEWAAKVADRMALFEDLPVAKQAEDFVRNLPSEEDLQKQVERTAAWIDGKWMEYASTQQSPHSETYGFMDDEFYEWLGNEFDKGAMPPGFREDFKYRKKWGSGADKFVNSYAQYLKTVVPTQRGWTLKPGTVPNFSVLGMPETVDIAELREVYPDTAKTGDSAVEQRYRAERVEIGDFALWVTDEGRDQKIKGDIEDLVRGRPYMERHWAAAQRVFELTYDRPYIHEERQDRKNIGHIWRYLSDQESTREITYK